MRDGPFEGFSLFYNANRTFLKQEKLVAFNHCALFSPPIPSVVSEFATLSAACFSEQTFAARGRL